MWQVRIRVQTEGLGRFPQLFLALCLSFPPLVRNCQQPGVGFVVPKQALAKTASVWLQPCFYFIFIEFSDFALWQKIVSPSLKPPKKSLEHFSPVPREVTFIKVTLSFSATHSSCVTWNKNAPFWPTWEERDTRSLLLLVSATEL